MPGEQFYATFLVQKGLKGVNPFGHTEIILSHWDGKDTRVEVTDGYGLYGTPSTQNNPIINWVKLKFGLWIDVKNNQGDFRKEAVRLLDQGKGLEGRTFKVSEKQYRYLQKRCEEILEAQNECREAIKNAYQEKNGKEPSSQEIFQRELCRSQSCGESPKLDRFELLLSITPYGPHLVGSHTCKNMVLNLFREIGIPDEQLKPMEEYAFPIYSGNNLETILFVSEGPLHPFKDKKTGKITFFKSWNENDTKKCGQAAKLFWTIPPQIIEGLNPTDDRPLLIPDSVRARSFKNISQLQQIHVLVTDASVSAANESHRQSLLSELYRRILSFSKKEQLKKLTDFEQINDDIESFVDTMFTAMQEGINKDHDVAQFAVNLDEHTQESICRVLDRPRYYACCGYGYY